MMSYQVNLRQCFKQLPSLSGFLSIFQLLSGSFINFFILQGTLIYNLHKLNLNIKHNIVYWHHGQKGGWNSSSFFFFFKLPTYLYSLLLTEIVTDKSNLLWNLYPDLQICLVHLWLEAHLHKESVNILIIFTDFFPPTLWNISSGRKNWKAFCCSSLHQSVLHASFV